MALCHSQGCEWLLWGNDWWVKMFKALVEEISDEPVRCLGLPYDCEYLMNAFNNSINTLESAVSIWKRFVLSKHSKHLWAKPLGRIPP